MKATSVPSLKRIKPTEQPPLNQWQSRGTWPQGLVNQLYNMLEDHMVEELAVQADPGMRTIFAHEDAKKLATFSKKLKITEKDNHRIMQANTWKEVIAGVLYCKLGKNQPTPAGLEIGTKTQTLEHKNLNLEEMTKDLNTVMNSFILLGDKPLIEAANEKTPNYKARLSSNENIGAVLLNDFLHKYEWVAEIAPDKEMEDLCTQIGVPAGIFVPKTKEPAGLELN
jgi:hypothetical protein